MPVNDPTGWLIAYDIRCRRRLGRVHRHLKKLAVPFHYSVFWFHGSVTQIRQVMDELADIVDAAVDDVRAYHIPVEPDVIVLGRARFPSGVHFTSERDSARADLLGPTDSGPSQPGKTSRGWTP